MQFTNQEAYQREVSAHRRINTKISPSMARYNVTSQFPQNTAEKYEKACEQSIQQNCAIIDQYLKQG